MNDKYAADPSAPENYYQLRQLLQEFGLFRGRYLMRFPEDWERLVISRLNAAFPVEQQRIKLALRRAQERLAFLSGPSGDWVLELDWSRDANRLVERIGRDLQGVIVAESRAPEISGALAFAHLDFPPTAEERIAPTPQEYARVCNVVVSHSYEVFLVDPYLDPTDVRVFPVLKEIFLIAGRVESKCRSITLVARAGLVFKDYKNSALCHAKRNRVKERLVQLRDLAGSKRALSVKFRAIDDSRSSDRLHDRYLFSIKGGVELRQGFQALKSTLRVTASPMSQETHRDVFVTFAEQETDMKVTWEIDV